MINNGKSIAVTIKTKYDAKIDLDKAVGDAIRFINNLYEVDALRLEKTYIKKKGLPCKKVTLNLEMIFEQ